MSEQGAAVRPCRGRRPAQIDPAELEALVRRGATLRQAAAAMGVSERTLGAHLAKRPELRAAVQVGKRVAVDIAGDKLRERAEAGSVTAMKLILRRAVGRQADETAYYAEIRARQPEWGG